jgi:hypothetical protein
MFLLMGGEQHPFSPFPGRFRIERGVNLLRTIQEKLPCSAIYPPDFSIRKSTEDIEPYIEANTASLLSTPFLKQKNFFFSCLAAFLTYHRLPLLFRLESSKLTLTKPNRFANVGQQNAFALCCPTRVT